MPPSGAVSDPSLMSSRRPFWISVYVLVAIVPSGSVVTLSCVVTVPVFTAVSTSVSTVPPGRVVVMVLVVVLPLTDLTFDELLNGTRRAVADPLGGRSVAASAGGNDQLVDELIIHLVAVDGLSLLVDRQSVLKRVLDVERKRIAAARGRRSTRDHVRGGQHLGDVGLPMAEITQIRRQIDDVRQ